MPRKQTEIPGTERTVLPNVTSAAESYVDVRDQRMKLTTEEVSKREILVMEMKEAGLDSYVDEEAGLEIVIEHRDKVKVRRLPEDGEG